MKNEPKTPKEFPFFLREDQIFNRENKLIGNIIFQAIVGSQCYGTATPESDIDLKGVYVQNPMDILTYGYVPQVEISKDEVYYEVRRFLELLETANPTVLELLYIPEECVKIRKKEYTLIEKHREKFLTKRCKNSIGGYAISQVAKAKGLNKKMNWESKEMVRKTPMDFCFIYKDGKTFPLEAYLIENGMRQEDCGLAALNHMKDAYALYYDKNAHLYSTGLKTKSYWKSGFWSKIFGGVAKPLGYKGITKEGSNELRLSDISKENQKHSLGVVFYNKDGYSMHCKDYREYTEWLGNRNTQRYVDIQNQKDSGKELIDGKNVMHCYRLMEMAKDIPTHKKLILKRPNAERLLEIRRGINVDLDAMVVDSGRILKELDDLFDNSDLPNEVEAGLIAKILKEIRIVQLCSFPVYTNAPELHYLRMELDEFKTTIKKPNTPESNIVSAYEIMLERLVPNYNV